MRKAFSRQRRLDCRTILDVELNLQCRDEMVPILRALQHIYAQPQLRGPILARVRQDVNGVARRDRGREGLDDWQILVLAAVRLGCNLDYDKLHDLAEQHRALRNIMGIGDWDQRTHFTWRRIRDNVCLLQPETIEKISHAIVAAGHQLAPEAIKKVRADSFVVETDIHYPTESSLIVDGIRKVLELCVLLSLTFGIDGWRQHEHLLKKVKETARHIGRLGARKGPHYKQRLRAPYRRLLAQASKVLVRARQLCRSLETEHLLEGATLARIMELKVFIERTEHVCATARRRVLEGEKVPNQDKLFSIFEPHTQLYKRGSRSNSAVWLWSTRTLRASSCITIFCRATRETKL